PGLGPSLNSDSRFSSGKTRRDARVALSIQSNSPAPPRSALPSRLLRWLSSGNLSDQLFDNRIAEGIEVFRDHDERAITTDDVVAIIVCKPARRVGVVGIEKGWCLSQDDEPVDRYALGERLVPRRSDWAAGIVVSVSRNVNDAPVCFVRRPIELGRREVDAGADRRAVGERPRCLDEAIAKQTCRLIVADHRPIDHNLL